MLLLTTARAATLSVGPSGDFATINAAEAAASSGDVLEIEAGTWAEDLNPNGKDLTYTAPEGATIVGAVGDPCLYVYGGEDVRVEKLSFVGCTHAIASARSRITVVESVFEGNVCLYGCAADVSVDTELVIEDSVFVDNLSTGGVGASLYIDRGATLTLSGSTFSGGQAPEGGEIGLSTAGLVVIRDSSFTDAGATGSGGVLWAYGGEDIQISGSRFEGGSAGAYGGLVYAYGTGDIEISDSDFVDGTATTHGGGLYLYNTGDLSFSEVHLEGNEAGSQGGGMLVANAELVMSGGAFTGNRAAYGGGFWDSPEPIRLTDVDFDDNVATVEGGGAWVIGGHSGTWEMNGGVVSGNVAGQNGGGLYVNDYEPQHFTGVHFEDNYAGTDGGGAFLHGNYGCCGPTVLTGNWFVGNSAGDDGGGFWSQRSGEIQVYQSVFFENEAADFGGGFGSEDTTVRVAGVLSAENVAGTGGGMGANVSYMYLANSTFACNDGDSYGSVTASGASGSDISGNVVVDNLGVAGLYVHYATTTVYDNDVWGNAGSNWTGIADPTGSAGNISEDPGLRGWSCDGAWAGDDFAPGEGAVVLDAYRSGSDVDGSAADLGAYGGAYGDLDADHDGWGYWAGDCHEGDPDIHPGAPDTWYDGVDSDCAGDDDDDADADGWTVDADCDDTDATIHPGAVDEPDNGVDEDCSGEDDSTDTGPVDTGPTDTGPTDTGPTDTGPTDTGPTDTGPVDTGPVDTGTTDTAPTDTGKAPTLEGVGGGCGCDSGGRSGGFTLLIAAAALLRRRAWLALPAVPGVALAADGTGLRADVPRVGGALATAPLGADAGTLDAALYGGVLGDSVVAHWSDGDEVLLGGLRSLTLAVGWAPISRLYLDASLPIGLGAEVGPPAGTTLDARVGAGFAALDRGGLRLGPRLALRIPTAAEPAYTSVGSVQVELHAVATAELGRVSLAGRAGVALGGAGEGLLAELAPAAWSVPAGAGLRVAVAGPFALGAEADAAFAPDDLSGVAHYSRAEALGFAALGWPRFDLVAGGGAGFGPGVGSPSWRALLALRGALLDGAPPAPAPVADVDPDKDGVADPADRCPTQAEDLDGYDDPDGCPDPDNDRDGLVDARDACPIDAEDRDGTRDEDGCPDPDNDQDGFPDLVDFCIDRPGTAPSGCPARVTVTERAIEVGERIYFDTGKASIQEVSWPILREVGAAINGDPDIAWVEVAGHTDSDGDDGANLALSQARAEAVRVFLVTYGGVDAKRLGARGYGETLPIADNATEAGRARNRRVEFVIMTRR